MKHVVNNPVTAVCLLFGALIPAAPMLWAAYRPEAQAYLRVAQDTLMRLLGVS